MKIDNRTRQLPSASPSRRREILVVLVVLAGVIALAIFGPDRSRGHDPRASEPPATPLG